MSNVEKLSIALTSEQAALLKAVVASGEYASSSEVVREALRGWQLERELRADQIAWLKEAWEKGKSSGTPKALDLESVHQEARKRLAKARAGTTHAG